MFTLPTQPITLSDSIKNIFQLWWTTLASVLPLSIAAGVLNILPILTKNYLGEGHQALHIAAFILVTIINIIPTTAIFAKLGHAAHNQEVTLSQALGVGIVKFPAVLTWIMICTVCMLLFVGLLYLMPTNSVIFLLSTLIAFLIITTLAIYVLCVIPIIVFENLPVIAAIQKSFALTKDQWWYAGILLTVVVIVGAIINIAGTLLMGPLGIIIAYCLTFPLQTSMIIIFYEHLKLRAEKISQKI